MEYEKQKQMIEQGKQIAYCEYNGKTGIDCAIQKKNFLYFVYICRRDFEYDAMDTGKKEYKTYEILDDAIAYIVSQGFDFDKFLPQKGNKIFNPDFYDYISCDK